MGETEEGAANEEEDGIGRQGEGTREKEDGSLAVSSAGRGGEAGREGRGGEGGGERSWYVVQQDKPTPQKKPL